MQVAWPSNAEEVMYGNADIRTRHISYFGDKLDLADGPQAFLVDKDFVGEVPDADEIVYVPAHYHRVRQFQLVVRGDAARIGKERTPPFSFHYIDPSSPYGPIFAGLDGIAFLTLRATADVGAYMMPGAKDRMRGRAGRNVVAKVEPEAPPAAGAGCEALIEVHEDGLAAFRLRLGPDETIAGPDPADTGGQYLYVAAGSLLHGGRDVDSSCLAWASPDDGAPELKAGSEGADVLVLQFPVVTLDETIDLTEMDPKILEQVRKRAKSAAR